MMPVIWPWRSGLHQTCPSDHIDMLAQFVDGGMIVAGDLVGQRQVGRVEDAGLGAEKAAAAAPLPRRTAGR